MAQVLKRTSRHAQLELLQAEYDHFLPFLVAGMRFLGFSTTPVQQDIGCFLEFGPNDLMVQAQRSQAKSTITAIFAVWFLIKDPQNRILIISAGGKQANEISTLVTRMILNWDILECLRPDASHGDRTSVEAFDVHYSLKGVDKSPSVACIGITGNLQGKRADLLIADDIESAKNSRTALMRELLLNLLRDFPSICVGRDGQPPKTVFLGTPQSDSSVYNTLPGSGYCVRIWPGRYPALGEEESYGDMLAPMIRRKMEADPSLRHGYGPTGKSGAPTDPDLLDDHALCTKENKQGPAYFQLQHMLCTLLSDMERYPLKTTHLIVMRLGEQLPMHFVRSMEATGLRQYQVGSIKFQTSATSFISPEMAKPTGRVMALDPAGGGKNGDETGVAVADQLGGNIFVRYAGAVKGGYDTDTLDKIVQLAKRFNPDTIIVEKNMGHGAFTQVLLPLLRKAGVSCAVIDVFHTGQKEQRIADCIEPVAARGSLVFDESVIQEDWASTQHYPADKRQIYTLMHQFTKLTRDRGALAKDDRLDALSMAIAYWVKALGQDSELVARAARDAELTKHFEDPLHHARYTDYAVRHAKFASTLPRRTRR
ncbi:DNA packaging protein [Pseudomonas phage PollyC]|uniref:DNA packaging protein n=1 Tax=Pseudomonas phage PollyC TaxID=2079290 RepID=A0A2K9VI38_9CAUD|nr:terminase large subunit [Pseudomonas phage PollyC]AUV61952.1 DNA packaging protein [Pseudomonas phage PollyC]